MSAGRRSRPYSSAPRGESHEGPPPRDVDATAASCCVATGWPPAPTTSG
jgi:hypothetical protein